MKGSELLANVHPALGDVLRAAEARGARFQVVQGRRSLSQQRELVRTGASKTLHSRHIGSGANGWAKAVDCAALGEDGQPDWAKGREEAVYGELNAQFQAAAEALGIPLIWGGSWSTPDWDHWELPVRQYP